MRLAWKRRDNEWAQVYRIGPNGPDHVGAVLIEVAKELMGSETPNIQAPERPNKTVAAMLAEKLSVDEAIESLLARPLRSEE